MRIITRQILAQERVEEFHRLCAQRAREMVFNSENHGRTVCVIYGELEALGPNPSPIEVERITGRPLAELPRCDECSKTPAPDSGSIVFDAGYESDPEESPHFAYICSACMFKAMRMLEAKP